MSSRAAALVAVVAALAAAQAAVAASEPANGRISFSAVRGEERVLYSRTSAGGALRLLAIAGPGDAPAWSPRGRRVAFQRGGRIFTAYADGTILQAVSSGPADGAPAWSPAGDALAFARGARGRRDIFRVFADGTAPRRLTASRRDDFDPAWSARGRLAFVRAGRSLDIYSMAGSGGVAAPLVASAAGELDPAWSPSGRTLAYAAGPAGRRDLWIATADGRGRRRLTAAAGDERQPVFSPDGTRIAFAATRGGRSRIYVLKVKGPPVRSLPDRGARVRRITSARARPRSPSWRPAGLDPVIAASADIACAPSAPDFNGGAGLPGRCRQRLSSDLLLRMDLDRVIAPGDLQYPSGELANFLGSFGPSWGRVKPLISPVPGNHEYETPAAAGYFDYFNGPGNISGPAGSRERGYYSFDLGAWHVVALNSDCSQVGGCGPDSPQARWLAADLAANPARCTLAFMHGPRFTSGRYTEYAAPVAALWDRLYAAGADVVVDGHEHAYERFAPQTPAGVADPRGIRQFTVGIGGKGRIPLIAVAPNSQVRNDNVIGVLRLTLGAAGYRWELVRAGSGSVADSGSARCS